jgi:zinc/manganese transport system permease protein
MLDAWFWSPVLALLLGVVALAPLGEQVLARGVVFIDLAVAQAAAAAALWVSVLVSHPSWLITQLLAGAGALLCAGLVAGLAKRWPGQREALIGLLYVFGASVALLGAGQDPHGRERLSQLLAADVLWADWAQVAVLAGCAVLVALAGRRLLKDGFFYPVFALVASMAVPALGLFVVFAALIAPALWQRAGLGRAASWLGAFAACGCGLAASWVFDAPSGPAVALALSAYGAFSALRSSAARTPS